MGGGSAPASAYADLAPAAASADSPWPNQAVGQVGKAQPESASLAHQARTVRAGSQLAFSQLSAASLAPR